MATPLTVNLFTKKADTVVSPNGWYVVDSTVKDPGGDDVVSGSGPEYGIRVATTVAYSTATLDTGAGNDVVTGFSDADAAVNRYGILIEAFAGSIARLGTGGGNDVVNGSSDSWGIRIGAGPGGTAVLDTGAGKDVVTGTGVRSGISVTTTGGFATLATGNGDDVVTGSSRGDNSGIYLDALNKGTVRLDTGGGNDVVAGTESGYGIFVQADNNSNAILATGAGNDVVTGSSTNYGIFFGGDGTARIETGIGKDVVDGSKGGFVGNGTTNLGDDDDTLRGFMRNNDFGIGNFYGGQGSDKILLGEGTYIITGTTIKSDVGGLFDIAMNVYEFEFIGGLNGGLFAFTNGIGILTVNGAGVATSLV